MQIIFYNNSCDNRQVDKNITAVKTVTAECFEDSSILNPVLICTYDAALFSANYLYIEYYGRYYFINDITIIDGHRIKISAHVDVLMTYAAQIKSLTVIVDKQKTLSGDNYFNDGSYVVDDRQSNNVVNFPNSLLDDGKYILITAGG